MANNKTNSILEALHRHGKNSNFIRWSLASLAQHGDEGLTRELSKSLLSETTTRLAHQYGACAKLKETWLVRGASNSTQLNNTAAQRKIVHDLDTLLYIHQDTFQLGRQIVQQDRIWERFSNADQHTLFATAEQLRSRHARTVETAVDIITNVRSSSFNAAADDDDDITRAFEQDMDQFLRGRLGVQLLCDHFVKLHKNKHNNSANNNNTGCVAVDCPIHDVLVDAITEASSLCDAHLQMVPETRISFDNDDTSFTTPTTCTTIRPWLHHALVEVLKNGMAATVIQQQKSCSSMEQEQEELPEPIDVRVSMEEEFIVIDVVDRGTGLMTRMAADSGDDDTSINNNNNNHGGVVDIRKAFSLGHSSVDKRWDRIDEQQSYASVRSPLSSLGVGLHSSRCMMEHFGGQVQLMNNDDAAGGCTARLMLSLDVDLLERDAIKGDEIDLPY